MKKRNIIILSSIAAFIVVIGFGPVVISMVLVRPARVQGKAMSPTLNNDDRVFFSGRVGSLRRGDIVLFYYPRDTSKSYIERVIGLPGESLEVREGKVMINGNILAESYVKEEYRSHDTFPSVQVPPNNYYVMGDNRINSSDSRYWGTVPKNLIYGKYIAKYWSAE